MTSSANEHEQTSPTVLRRFSSLLLVFGFVVVLAGVIVLVAATFLSGGGSESYGIVIFIGPIPIVIGSGPEAPWLILFAAILASLSIAFFLLMYKKSEKIGV
jgi:uncharacterized membrane protein